MYQSVAGIYQDGIITPLEPLKVPDKTRVIITVLPEKEPDDAERRFLVALQARGVITEIPRENDYKDKKKRSRIKIKGKPLSQTIIEERI